MNRSVAKLFHIFVLALVGLSPCFSQQNDANPLLGEWYLGFADPAVDKGLIFREDATLLFDEKYMHMKEQGATVSKIEYMIQDNYLTLLEDGEAMKCRIQFLDKDTFVLYPPSIAEMLEDMPSDEKATIIESGEEKPLLAGRRK